jgi:single-strand DNA-binding protein
MAHLFGMARIGKDAEVRTVGNDSVCNLSLAFSHHDKTAEKGRGTQWVDGSLWGKRAESLAPYLKKGAAVAVTLEDVHIQEYATRDGGTGHKLIGRVVSIELGPRPDGGSSPAPAPRAAAPAPRPAVSAQPASAGDDMDDDIPF